MKFLYWTPINADLQDFKCSTHNTQRGTEYKPSAFVCENLRPNERKMNEDF